MYRFLAAAVGYREFAADRVIQSFPSQKKMLSPHRGLSIDVKLNEIHP